MAAVSYRCRLITNVFTHQTLRKLSDSDATQAPLKQDLIKLLKERKTKHEPECLESDPLHVKRKPINGYNMFWRQHYPEMIAEEMRDEDSLPDRRRHAILKLTRRWREMSPEAKQPYQDAAIKESSFVCIGPISGYNIFWKKHYHEIMKQQINADLKDRRKAAIQKLAEVWRSMSAEERKPYREEAFREHERINRLKDQINDTSKKR